ncbi:hypothetical protein VTJ83DRAFT_290 [Remersonia thermophila]|uniref:Uncharacterized protein n=1 Tax=Remersonia thermophila TaxID=72144 RepID=A0ABR4DLM7_9PEZI
MVMITTSQPNLAMTCSQSPDASTSTLCEVRTRSAPPYDSLSPPPRRRLENLRQEFLPPSSLRRNPGVIAFGQEVDAALATPEPAMSADEASILLMFRLEGPAESHQDKPNPAESEHATGKHLKRKKKTPDLRLRSADGAQEPLDAALPPQAQPPIYTVYEVTGMQHVPSVRETTPTGHRSEKKIHKITGLEVASERPGQRHGGHKEPLDSEVSSGSEHGDEQGSGYRNADRHVRRSFDSSAMPSPLRIAKHPPRPPGRSPERPVSCSPRYSRELTRSPLSPRFERFSLGFGRDTPGIESAPDLYHEAAQELARQDPLTAQQSKPDATIRLAAEMLLRPVSAPGIDDRYPRSPPAFWQQEPRRSLGARTLGSLPDRLRSRLSVSPSPSRNPSQRRWGRSGNHDEIGTPETGGSVPLSLPSDISTPTSSLPDGAPSPRRTSRGSSLVAKVFRRSVPSPSSPVPPIGSTPFNSPVSPRAQPADSFANPMRRSPPSQHSHGQPSLLPPSHDRRHPMHRDSPAATAAASPASAPIAKEPEAPRSLINQHLSSLAARTNNLAAAVATAAAGLLNKGATGLSSLAAGGEGRRRREQLKSSIRVMPDGRRVGPEAAGDAAEDVEGSGGWSRVVFGVGFGSEERLAIASSVPVAPPPPPPQPPPLLPPPPLFPSAAATAHDAHGAAGGGAGVDVNRRV